VRSAVFTVMLHEVSGRSFGVLLGMAVGSLTTAFIARRRRMKERQSILKGDARDTIVIHQHVLEPTQVTTASGETKSVTALRVRTLGQSELNRVVPNGHLAGNPFETRATCNSEADADFDGRRGRFVSSGDVNEFRL
jgi:hypothetical protein